MAVKELYQVKQSGGIDSQDKFLRKQTEKVNIINEEILRVINDLRDTLWAYPICVGLSAPQIGESYSISVINVEKKDRSADLIMINPVILEQSGKKDKKRESCMSVWGKMGEVERRDKILVQYLDLEMNVIQRRFEGFYSRAVQHEIDHLNGIIYLDKLVSGEELREAALFSDYEIIK